MLVKSRAAIWLTLSILGILGLSGITNLKTRAQTQSQCTDVEIEKNIGQLTGNEPEQSVIDALVVNAIEKRYKEMSRPAFDQSSLPSRTLLYSYPPPPPSSYPYFSPPPPPGFTP